MSMRRVGFVPVVLSAFLWVAPAFAIDPVSVQTNASGDSGSITVVLPIALNEAQKIFMDDLGEFISGFPLIQSSQTHGASAFKETSKTQNSVTTGRTKLIYVTTSYPKLAPTGYFNVEEARTEYNPADACKASGTCPDRSSLTMTGPSFFYWDVTSFERTPPLRDILSLQISATTVKLGTQVSFSLGVQDASRFSQYLQQLYAKKKIQAVPSNEEIFKVFFAWTKAKISKL